jgi:hypothetical protein
VNAAAISDALGARSIGNVPGRGGNRVAAAA